MIDFLKKIFQNEEIKAILKFQRILPSNKFSYLIFSLRQKYYQLCKSID